MHLILSSHHLKAYQVKTKPDVFEYAKSLFSLVGLCDGNESCFIVNRGEHAFTVNKCRFENVGWCLSGVTRADQCEFITCRIAMHWEGMRNIVGKSGSIVQNCRFTNCEKAINNGANEKIFGCYFDNCKDEILSLEGDCIVERCEFKNIDIKENNEDWRVQKMISCFGDSQRIVNCRFINITKTSVNDIKYLIGFEGLDKFKKKVLQMDNCQFIGCKGHLINCYHHWYEEESWLSSAKSGEELAISFSNCEGIDNNGYAL